MKIKENVPLMDQARALKNPCLLEILSKLSADERPQKIHALLIAEAELGNIEGAHKALGILWPSVLEIKGYQNLLHRNGNKTHDLTSAVQDEVLVDRVIVQYIGLLDLACGQIILRTTFPEGEVNPLSKILESIGVEILMACNLIPNEMLATKHFQGFLFRYMSEMLISHQDSRAMVLQSFKGIDEVVRSNTFFADRAIAYIRVLREFSDNSGRNFIQLRTQIEMLDKVSRVLGIEVVKRVPGEKLLQLFTESRVAA